ncbi:MAG: S8 family serine peptidase, partial [Candidatus Sumerlaeota bacterium]|nr:S8 family serine peptidase [Candidatus Sumerlaeota bacterium]
AFGKKQLFLVQFDGPIQPEWLEKLSAGGLTPAQYAPNFAYLVYGDPARLAGGQAPAEVVWAGPLRAADRIDPALQPIALAAAPPETVQPVIVQYFALEDARETAQDLTLYALTPVRPARVGNHFTARLDVRAKDIAALAALPLVYNVEPQPAYERFGEREALVDADQIADAQGCPSPPVAGTHYSDFLARKGVDGSGVVVHLDDDGLDQGNASNAPGTAHPDLLGRIVAILNDTSDPLGDSGAGHGEINAGILMGFPTAGGPHADAQGFLLGQGIAPGARIVSSKIFRNSGPFDIGSRTFGDIFTEVAPYHPAVSNNSWGANVGGAYTSESADFDALVRDSDAETAGDQPLTMCFAAGNAGRSGTGAIGSPATAKNVVAVGAAENCNPFDTDGCGIGPTGADNVAELAVFSSRGPTVDGRFGVTIVAPGTHITGPASTSPNFDGTGVCGGPNNGGSPSAANAYYPAGQTDYTWSSGTSHSTPQASGAAALFTQYCQETYGAPPSPAMVKAALTNSATDVAAGLGPAAPVATHVPNADVGWGLLNLDRLIPDLGRFAPRFILDQSLVFHQNGDSAEFPITAIDSATPLRITLCWSDPPGLPGVSPNLVNDLDLQVVQGGTVYLGNVFADGVSTTGGSPDRLENLEAVYLAAPSGTYSVRVTAAYLAADGVPSAPGAIDQDFALFVSGGINQSPAGTISFDRPFYRLTDSILATVSDSDLRGRASVDVQVASDSSPAGEAVTLQASPLGTGLFQGRIAISPTGAGGALPVASGDQVRGVYQDANDGTGSPATATATATVDGTAPQVADLRVGEMTPDSAEILFQTDEPARSTLQYGPTCAYQPNSVQEVDFAHDHRVVITGLDPGTVYGLRALVFDRAGNPTLTACVQFRTPETLCGATYDMESGGQAPFTHGADVGTDDWTIAATALAHSPQHAWFVGDPATLKDASLVLSLGATPLPPRSQLVFWHTYSLDSSYDGAVLEYRIDQGPWLDLGPRLVEGGYTATLAISDNVLTGRSAWSGGAMAAMTRVRADLSAFVGQRLSIRWRIGTDSVIGGAGWAIDDIQVCSTVGSRGEAQFDAAAYRAGTNLTLFLSDADLVGAPSATLFLDSASELPGETIVLSPIGPGQFAASVPVVSNAFGVDGRIGVRDGDLITATYLDANDGTGAANIATATARADLASPQLIQTEPFSATTRAAQLHLQTDEPATIDVQANGSQGDNKKAAVSGLAQAFDIVLSDLTPCDRYLLTITTTDALGNQGVFSGASEPFEFVTPDETALFFDSIEPTAAAGWTHSAALGVDDWSVATYDQAKSPTHVWSASDTSTVKDAFLTLPPADLQAGDFLIFWHTYEFETGAKIGFDGGVLEISTDGGTTWNDMESGFRFGAAYDQTLSSEFGNPLGGRRAFTGGALGAMRPVYVSLDAWAGAQRLIRFRLGCDTSVGAAGWRLDDIRLSRPKPCKALQNAARREWRLYE